PGLTSVMAVCTSFSMIAKLPSSWVAFRVSRAGLPLRRHVGDREQGVQAIVVIAAGEDGARGRRFAPLGRSLRAAGGDLEAERLRVIQHVLVVAEDRQEEELLPLGVRHLVRAQPERV